ncbi:hypothetical protein FKM82_024930 [Ascaphus truei]
MIRRYREGGCHVCACAERGSQRSRMRRTGSCRRCACAERRLRAPKGGCACAEGGELRDCACAHTENHRFRSPAMFALRRALRTEPAACPGPSYIHRHTQILER